MATNNKKVSKKRVVAIDANGQAHIKATFNNIIISITNSTGQVVSWASAGKMGFRGSKKNTPYDFTIILCKLTNSISIKSSNYDKVKELNQFINIERLRNNSITTPFAIQEDMLGLISSILPLTNSREFIKFTADKLGDEGDLKFLDSRLKDRFRREFPSGFIQYVFQTMQSPESVKALSMVMGIDLEGGSESPLTFQQALKDFHKNFYKTLVLFKRNNPAMIEKYTLLSNLFINTSNKKSIIGKSINNFCRKSRADFRLSPTNCPKSSRKS